jgi:hypothetical protein
MIFSKIFISRCRHTDVRTIVLSPVSLLPVIFIAGIVDTGDTQNVVNISANFRKNSKCPDGILKDPGKTDT